MHQPHFYDLISLVLLILGGILMLIALAFALYSQWLFGLITSLCAITFWHMSSLFAKYSVATSTRKH